jgi:hypothetical protein
MNSRSYDSKGEAWVNQRHRPPKKLKEGYYVCTSHDAATEAEFGE